MSKLEWYANATRGDTREAYGKSWSVEKIEDDGTIWWGSSYGKAEVCCPKPQGDQVHVGVNRRLGQLGSITWTDAGLHRYLVATLESDDKAQELGQPMAEYWTKRRNEMLAKAYAVIDPNKAFAPSFDPNKFKVHIG